MTYSVPGGGGFGDPFTRDVDRVVADVAAGFVSREGAARDYGVAIDPATGAVDAKATAELRGSK
jgi:N-methylhydantoinase B